MYAMYATGIWSQCQTLTDSANGDTFGWSVAIEAGVIVVGASSRNEDTVVDAG